jgi:4'-phosphopantetheinyl transferase
MQWLARGELDVPVGQQWLTPTEAQRAASMKFTKRRTEYLLRRFAGKIAVAAVTGMPSDPAGLGRIGVLNRRTGAPYVQVDGTELGLDVSLTDRAGWAVCLVAPDLGAVGVDLEIVEPRSRGFVRDFLTPAEQELVASVPGPDGFDAAANLIWSAKESALKVLRTGLRADTRSVEVKIADPQAIADSLATADPLATADAASAGWQRLHVTSGADRFPGWWRRDGVFLLTVVAATGLAEPPTVLTGSADLTRAEPLHSWVAKPLVD